MIQRHKKKYLIRNYATYYAESLQMTHSFDSLFELSLYIDNHSDFIRNVHDRALHGCSYPKTPKNFDEFLLAVRDRWAELYGKD